MKNIVFLALIVVSYLIGTMMPTVGAAADCQCVPCEQQPAAGAPAPKATTAPAAPAPTAPAPKATTAPAAPAAPAPKININTATIAELDTIPGVGPVIAQRIVEGRPYYNGTDLLEIKGIGDKKLEKMLPFITW